VRYRIRRSLSIISFFRSFIISYPFPWSIRPSDTGHIRHHFRHHMASTVEKALLNKPRMHQQMKTWVRCSTDCSYLTLRLSDFHLFLSFRSYKLPFIQVPAHKMASLDAIALNYNSRINEVFTTFATSYKTESQTEWRHQRWNCDRCKIEKYRKNQLQYILTN
jgi:hypothetical protein